MLKKYLLTFFLIVSIFIFHQSVILNFDWRLNLWPIILVFILFTFSSELSLFWVTVVGFLLDLYSVLPFGIYLSLLFLCLFVIYILAKNFITNRSLISFLILSLLATILFNLELFVVQKFFLWFDVLDKELIISFKIILIQMVSNLILALILFFITFKFTNKLKTDLIID